MATTAEQWREVLAIELAARQKKVQLYDRYYEGDHRLAFATPKFKEAFGELFEAFATNWCGLVVDTPVERLKIEGFRFGEEESDDDAWLIWQSNKLDSRSIQAHTEAGKTGWSYVMVAPPAEDDPRQLPKITVEHPSQVVVAHDPSDRMQRLAAYKRFTTIGGDTIEVVYEPDTITTWITSGLRQRMEGFGIIIPGFSDVRSEKVVRSNPLGKVPIVPIENNPDMLRGGRSDLQPAISLNDAANKFFTDMLIASEYAAFPQRVLLGVEIPKNPVTGEPLKGSDLEANLSRLWMFEDKESSFGQFTPADLGNYVTALETAVQHLAAQTRTPPHYLLAKLVNLSGDALKAAETGLVARCLRKQLDYEESWEEALRLAFRQRAIAWKARGQSELATLDEARADEVEAETFWANPESQVPTSVADAISKKANVGWPQELLFQEGGMSAQEIKRARDAKQADPADLSLKQKLGVPQEQLWKELGYSPGEIAKLKEMRDAAQQAQAARAQDFGPQGPGGQKPAKDPKQNGKGQQPTDAARARS